MRPTDADLQPRRIEPYPPAPLTVDAHALEIDPRTMSTRDAVPSPAQTMDPAPPPAMSRDELIALVAKAHHDSGYGESQLAGKTLAGQSKLPKIIAENLGAGFGQWDFFPEAAEIVDFAAAYTPPSTEEDVWTMARAWASDDAASRHTLMALVGREILQHELRRIDVPKLRELFDETRSSRALALRSSLGLAVPSSATTTAKPEPKARAATASGAPKRAPVEKREIPTRMPKPEFKKPPPPAPPPIAKRFQHPKFGEGVLEAQDGAGPEAKLTIKFELGSKTLLAKYVTEVPSEAP